MKKLSLNIQIFLGAAVGVIGGLIFHKLGLDHPLFLKFLYVSEILSTIFVGLLQMIVIPLIFISITIGIANLKAHHQMQRVWKITLIYFLATPIFAAILGLLMMNIFKPGVGLNISLFADQISNFSAQNMTMGEFFKKFVGGLFQNHVAAMATGNILAVVVFSIFLGIALIVLSSKTKTIMLALNESYEVVMLIVGWIMKVAPIGIMALLFKLIATQDITLFKSVGLFMAIVTGTTLFHGIVVLPLILYFFTRITPIKFFKAMQSAFVVAFSTSSSSATMPVSMRCVEENLKVDKDIAGFVLPLGTTVNMDGTAMYEAAAALFIANIMGLELNLVQQIVVVLTSVVASIGAPGIPSAGMVTMIMVLQSVGLPVEAIAILLPIDRPLDTVRTVVNVEGDAVCAAIVQKLTSPAKA